MAKQTSDKETTKSFALSLAKGPFTAEIVIYFILGLYGRYRAE